MLKNFGKENRLNGLEIIKNLIIDNVDWPTLGLVTPVLKSKRNELRKYYDKKLEALYDEKL